MVPLSPSCPPASWFFTFAPSSMHNYQRQTFARLSADADPGTVPSSVFQAARNLWLEPGFLTGARGNELIAFALPDGENKAVGFCDDTNSGVFCFVANSLNNHHVIHYTPDGNCGVFVQGSALQLRADVPVLGAVVLDGLLLYRDAHKQLRAVPVDTTARAQAVAALALDPFALHLVHQAPQVTPSARREVNTNTQNDPRARANNIADSAYQFAFQFEYPSGERTPLGPYSDLLPVLNKTTPDEVDPRNFIRVDYPSGSLAPSPLVASVRLLVRTQGVAWQVAGTFTPGTAFDFYGASTSEVLPAVDAAKLSEALPVEVGCMTVGQSRVFVGDCTEGYAPTADVAGLSAVAGTAPASGGEAITAYRVRTFFNSYYIDNDDIERAETTQRTLYYQLVSGTYGDEASTYRRLLEQTGSFYAHPDTATYTYAQAFVDFQADELPSEGRTIDVLQGFFLNTTPPTQGEVTLHENSAYPVGLAYYDELGRTAGAEAVRLVLVPRQNYAAPVAQNIRWTLNSTPPVWARTYHLLLGQNRTASFLQQFKADGLRQFRGDNPDGSPKLEMMETGGTAFNKAIWVSLTPLVTGGRGYVFEAGDRLRFPAIQDRPADFVILYERAGWVAISATAYTLFRDSQGNDLNDFLPVVELYRPVPQVESPVLYERGPRYAVLNPGTDERTLSVTSGVLAGDAYLLPFQFGGSIQTLEAMTPSLIDADLWLDASRGRAIPVLTQGRQQRRSSLLRFSGVKVQGTKLMGLSVWDATAQDDLPQEQGAVVRIGIADQTQAEGSLLLCVQERGAESRYLGQTAIQQADGQTTLALTKGVLGGGNALRGGFGLAPRHAATFFTYAGRAYWYCYERGELIRYAQSGVVPLGLTYGFQGRLQDASRLHGLGTAVAGFDPRPNRSEVWLTFPDVAASAPVLGVEGDVAEGQTPTPSSTGQTLAFSERHETWVDSYTARPECFAFAGSRLLSFQNGAGWAHTERSPYGSFFGEYRAPWLQVTVGAASGIAKLWRGIDVESAGRWVPTRLRIERPGNDSMQSAMQPKWLTFLEGVYRGAFRRDQNSPGGLLNGRPLVGERLTIDLQASEGQEHEPLRGVSVAWQPRPGQRS
jgi:hypothetical protein